MLGPQDERGFPSSFSLTPLHLTWAITWEPNVTGLIKYHGVQFSADKVKSFKPCRKCGCQWRYDHTGGGCPYCVSIRTRRYGKENRQRKNEWNKAWERANPERFKRIAQRKKSRRRARKELVPSEPWSRSEILEKYNHRCCQCGGTEGLVIDHVQPITWFGPDRSDNLQVLCQKHNSTKGSHSCNDYRWRFQLPAEIPERETVT